jgi:hypothetical protein
VVTVEQLHRALYVVRVATVEFVDLDFFQPGVLVRLDKWIRGLPNERVDLATNIALMAGQRFSGTGADINGVALDEKGKPSLESLVLHYDAQEPGLFPEDVLASVRSKLAIHNGPRYLGPWP